MKTEIPLTVLDKDFQAKVNKTPMGMAFWAGTGPKGKTCRECTSFMFPTYYSGGKNGETLKPSTCRKFGELSKREGRAIPHDTESCKYFEQNETPPTISKPQKVRS